VLPSGNTIIVYYTKTLANTPVTVTFVDKDDNQNILNQIIGSKLYIGQTYQYTIPGSLPDANGGLWAPSADTPGIYNHTITANNNDIVIPFEKLMTSVTINYIDYEDGQNIVYTETINVQVGINYTYEYAPEKYVDPKTGDHWELIPQQDMSIVIDTDSQNNVINIQYLKISGTTKVVVTGEWLGLDVDAEVVVVLTNLISGKKYHGLLRNGESVIYKYLPLGTYSIYCMDQLTSGYVGSDVENNIFAIEDLNDEIEIEVTNQSKQPKGFYSLDSADNMMKIYIEGD